MTYDDILHLPHPTSQRHPRMSMWDRAAQFSPFAALTGHGAAIEETARLTYQQLELAEDDKQVLDRKMMFLQSKLSEHPKIQITYFLPDERKSGGSYRIADGKVKKMDEQSLTLESGLCIALHFILDIQGEILENID